jgi:FRG domain
MEKVKQISIQSLSHIKDVIVENKTESLVLYRGQNKNYDLRPGIARNINNKSIIETEILIFNDFKKRIGFFSESQNKSYRTDWDYLVDAQHYGLRTRLLDWSSDPMIALWFATSFDPEKNGFGVLWIYKVQSNYIKLFNQLPTNPFTIREPIVFKPKENNNLRIDNQSSWFITYPLGLDFSTVFNLQKGVSSYLVKLTIPNSKFLEIRTNIEKERGISAESLFNSVDKMCEDINKSFGL